MILSEWAKRHRINDEALQELKIIMGRFYSEVYPVSKINQKSEKVIQQYIRLKESQYGNRLWRNNNGATYDQTGRMIRYGLGNDSVSLNKKIKSSDLIGITPKIIQPRDIGSTWGIFTSIEVKKDGWRYIGTEQEKAQYAWIKLIISMGGIAKFSNGLEYK
jgi:hypothetical protein